MKNYFNINYNFYLFQIKNLTIKKERKKERKIVKITKECMTKNSLLLVHMTLIVFKRNFLVE